MYEWVKKSNLPKTKCVDIESRLEELGVTEPEDLSGLLDNEVDDLLKLVPRLKHDKFMDQMIIFRPVCALFSFY